MFHNSNWIVLFSKTWLYLFKKAAPFLSIGGAFLGVMSLKAANNTKERYLKII